MGQASGSLLNFCCVAADSYRLLYCLSRFGGIHIVMQWALQFDMLSSPDSYRGTIC
jgi:hypothetical protein